MTDRVADHPIVPKVLGARRPPSWLKLATVAGAVFLPLLAAEAALRVADAAGWVRDWDQTRTARTASIWQRSDNPTLIYEHRSNYFSGGVRYTDDHGILRPTIVSPEPAAGALRVVALGDSVGAAYTLPYEQRVFTLVEESLVRALVRPVEVLNFCVTGYSTLQEAALFETRASGFKPDIVVLQYCVNDFYPSEYPARWFREWPGDTSYGVAFLARRLDTRVLRGFPPADYWQDLYRTDRKGWQNVAAGFDRVASAARVNGAPVLVVLFPALSQEGWFAGDAKGRHARVTELARERHFHVLDLLPILSEYPVDELRLSRKDTLHPNPRGNAVAAQPISTALAQLTTTMKQ